MPVPPPRPPQRRRRNRRGAYAADPVRGPKAGGRNPRDRPRAEQDSRLTGRRRSHQTGRPMRPHRPAGWPRGTKKPGRPGVVPGTGFGCIVPPSAAWDQDERGRAGPDLDAPGSLSSWHLPTCSWHPPNSAMSWGNAERQRRQIHPLRPWGIRGSFPPMNQVHVPVQQLPAPNDPTAACDPPQYRVQKVRSPRIDV